MPKNKYILKIFKGCLVLTVLLLCGCAKERDLVIETASKESVAETEECENADLSGTENGEVLQLPEPDMIYVQVTGAVHEPGVYELPVGSRVFEAVQMAGGMTENAAAESLNQALEVYDGQMIVVCTQQEWSQMQAVADTGIGAGGGGGVSAEKVPDDGRVNINTAGPEELCTISGIGQSRAQSIITYREQNGEFGSIEEIMNVSGIKDGLFQKIKDKIKV